MTNLNYQYRALQVVCSYPNHLILICNSSLCTISSNLQDPEVLPFYLFYLSKVTIKRVLIVLERGHWQGCKWSYHGGINGSGFHTDPSLRVFQVSYLQDVNELVSLSLLLNLFLASLILLGQESLQLISFCRQVIQALLALSITSFRFAFQD